MPDDRDMRELRATPVHTIDPAVHGEGPTWDSTRGELIWVDIPQGEVRRASVSADGAVAEIAVHRAGDTASVVVPAVEGGWLVGADEGFCHLSPDGALRQLVELSGEGGDRPGGTRTNDGGVDPVGRFFAGTMAFDKRTGAGALYRVDLDGSVHTQLADVTISNGIVWTADGCTVYFIDSGPATVVAFDYDVETGAFGQRRVVVDLSDDDAGVPDGMTLDAEDHLWVAVFGGGQVRRYSPDGEQVAVVTVSAQQTTSCAFAGPDLDQLVISTSTQGLTDQDRAAQPDAGRLFIAKPGLTGQAAGVYRGPL